MKCKKQNTPISDQKNPTAVFVSTTARLLDTAAFAPKRYMHFLITFDIITGDSDIYFSQLPADYSEFVRFMGPDTVYSFTPYRPSIIPGIPEIVPESDIFKMNAHDTVRVTYFGMIIAHGPWKNFYMQAYRFPYSFGMNDGDYKSTVVFDTLFKTSFPQ